jgi:hypothetical protein
VKNRFQSLPFKCNLQRYNTGGGLRALRAMRALRPLRTITRFESLRSVVVCFVEAVPLLLSVVGLVFFFTFLFAIAGQQLFVVGRCRLNQVDPYPITYSLSNP